jgi:GT2 family glycosyltransferase
VQSVSVATLARGRSEHLWNVVLGLTKQTLPPVELIIAVMQDTPYDLPDAPFPIKQVAIPGTNLPLATARNTAAKVAHGNLLVFVDIDCIPAPSFIADYTAGLAALDGLLMGEVLYLPGGLAVPGWSYDSFAAAAVKHSDRRGPPASGVEQCNDYRCFWSLNFGMRRATFLATGGFDERYVGYGGEDTDFGKSLTNQGIAIGWLKGALAYHQYHPHHMPPVHHLESVVRNAQLFEEKWGYRTMGHWLHAFKLMGLIDDAPNGPLRILRRPDCNDLFLTGQQSHQPYANTTTVIQALEEMAAGAVTSPAQAAE